MPCGILSGGDRALWNFVRWRPCLVELCQVTTVPCGILSGGVRTSRTWTGQHLSRLYDSIRHDDEKNDDDDDDDDSDSDGEGWC